MEVLGLQMYVIAPSFMWVPGMERCYEDCTASIWTQEDISQVKYNLLLQNDEKSNS